MFSFLFRPFGRDTFLCSAKEKYPKERRSRRLARDLNLQGRFAALPMRFSCKPALAQLAALKQGASLPRFPLRCSAAPDGWEIKTQNNTLNQPPHSRLHSPSTAANPGSRRAPCLSVSSTARSRVVRAPGLARNARNRRQPMSAPGCPSLWVLSLGHSRESTSPEWAKQKDQTRAIALQCTTGE